jgi:S-adenosylmethionine synthetase
VLKNFDMRPRAIIDQLNLQQPIYKKTAAFGHFGRADIVFPWEKCDKVAVLCKALENI